MFVFYVISVLLYNFESWYEKKETSGNEEMTIYAPGYHFFKVFATSVSDIVAEDSQFVFISDEVRGIYFTEVSALEVNVTKQMYVYISSGNSLQVHITEKVQLTLTAGNTLYSITTGIHYITYSYYIILNRRV